MIRLIVCCLVACFLVSPSVAWAGPSTRDPEQPLALWSDGEAVALDAEARKLMAEMDKILGTLSKRQKAGQVKQIKPLEVGRLYVLSLQLDRLAERLELWRETPGFAFRIDARELGERVGAVVRQLRDPLAEVLTRGYPVFKARAEQRSSVLDQANKLSSQQQPEKAEAKFLPTFDELNTMAVWYEGPVLKDAFGAYLDYYGGLSSTLRSIRAQSARKAIGEARAARAVDLAAFRSRLATATTSIGQDGQAAWDDKQLSGPELITAAFAERRKLDVATAACVGLDWAYPFVPGKPDPGAAVADATRLAADFPVALAAIVEADAGRVSEAEAGALYASYLTALSAWQNPIDIAPPPSVLTTALDKLAAKSPQLAANVAVYRRATSDFLRWRARSAEARARRARQDFNATLTELRAQDAPGFAEFLEVSVRKVLDKARDNRLSLHLAVSRPWTPGSGGMVNTGEFAYTCSMRDLSSANEVARLKADLQTAEVPPLTLETAWATASAERGDLQEIGGEVINVEIEGIVARHVRCSEADWGTLDIGRMINRFTPTNPAKTISYRAELKPKFLRGNYFFVQLP